MPLQMVMIISKIYFQTLWWSTDPNGGRNLKCYLVSTKCLLHSFSNSKRFPSWQSVLQLETCETQTWHFSCRFPYILVATCMITSGVREEALGQCFCTIRESSWHLFSGIFLPAWLALMPLQPIYLSWSLDLPQDETQQHSLR